MTQRTVTRPRNTLPLLLALAACQGRTTPTPAQGTPVAGYEVVAGYPHDRGAFTQGLVFHQGRFFESTGQEGQSTVREVELETGRVLRQRAIGDEHFGEGLALRGGRLYQLTWHSKVGFVWDAATFEAAGRWSYTGEGWGLTDAGEHLVMSDGTATLRFLDPATLAVVRTVKVTDAGREVRFLNELELVKGELFANIWGSNRLVRIDPASGAVRGYVDLTGLLPASERNGREDVLNGIAYDAAGDRLFVTGKYWPKLYQVRLVER